MIELPSGVYPQSVSMALVDFGGTIRPVLGGAAQRVNRLGSRYRAIVSLPPLEFETGRTVVSRLIRAKSEALRLALPGTRGQQGAPGTGVQVDGAVAGGQNRAELTPEPGLAGGMEGNGPARRDAVAVAFAHGARQFDLHAPLRG